jgi:predicted phage terminase large subunit-like protein
MTRRNMLKATLGSMALGDIQAVAKAVRVMKSTPQQLTEEASALSADLSLYMSEAWHVLEPNTPFVPGWHLDAIAEHLTAVDAGEILDLIINMPPRCMKSLSVVMWQTWRWTRAPWTRWLCSSYSQNLSTRDSVKSRRLIQSHWYQKHWGHIYTLTTDQNVKTRFENDRTGYRVATSVDGMGTGEGGDVIVFDDPHNVREAESELKREATVRYWHESMSTRRNDPKKSARVVIQQRVHQRDLTGDLLEGDYGYVHLMLPMRYERARACVTVLGWEDPRKEEGELLWPDRYSEDDVGKLERDLGPYGAAGQLQQTPTARSGGMFERAWFEIIPRVPHGSVMVAWVRYWDKAGTQDAGAYTSGVLMGLRNDGKLYVQDVVRGQWAAGDRERIIMETASGDALFFGVAQNGRTQPDKLAVLQMVEQEPGSGGKDSAQQTMRNLAGYRVEAERATGDKFTRADPLAGAAKLGEVYLVEGQWNRAFLDEVEAAGPGAAYLDQMDAASGAYNRLMRFLDGYIPGDGIEIPEDFRVSPHAIV